MRSFYRVFSACGCGLVVLLLIASIVRVSTERPAVAEQFAAQPAQIRAQTAPPRFGATIDHANQPRRVQPDNALPGPVFDPYSPTVSSGQRFNNGFQPRRAFAETSLQPVIVQIKDGPQLRGVPVNLAVIEFNGVFGRIAVPLECISGIRVDNQAKNATTICFWNGDCLTGSLVTETISIKTPWGSATIGREHLVSILTTEEVKWEQRDGRWQLTPATADSRPKLRADSPDPTNGEQLPADHVPNLNTIPETSSPILDAEEATPEKAGDFEAPPELVPSK